LGHRVEIQSVYIGPEDSPFDIHISVLNAWKNKCDGRLAPSWSEYSLLDFPSSEIPFISLTDLSNSPLHSVYRFWGTGLTQVFGGDYTGKTPADVPPRSLGISSNGGCARLVNDLAPHYEVKEFLRDNGVFGRALVLRLPFSDDNKIVNHGINMYKFELNGAESPLKTYFDEVFSKVSSDVLAPKLPNISHKIPV